MKKSKNEKKCDLKIEIAPHAGFCFGVKRAVDLTIQTLKKYQRAYSCGPLIHNPQVIEELKEKGFCMVDGPKDVPSEAVFIVRSHGVAPDLLQVLKKKKVKIIDATCPFVKKAQKIAGNFYRKGYQTVICGDPSHAEVIGINAQTKNTALIFDDAKKIPKNSLGKKIGVLCQTTQKIFLLKSVAEKLLDYNKSLVIENTICLDSSTKQEEAAELAQRVDLMIVVGGKNSSNTTKLAQISQATKTKTFHIETEKEIMKEWLKGVKKIGLTAGASTPQRAIEKVVEKIKELS